MRVLGTPVAADPRHRGPGAVRERLTEIGVKTPEAVPAVRRRRPRAAVGRSASRSCCGAALRWRQGQRHRREPRRTRGRPEARFAGGAPQVLVEECLRGWKEIEYEVVRDGRDNCITVCNMENFDPMGIHTGESIVVAPSQTLNDEEYQLLRTMAIRTIRHLGIVGECNIQYALDPSSSDYRVIEVNARLSRSSALASKATGIRWPTWRQVALGYTLPEIPNGITRARRRSSSRRSTTSSASCRAGTSASSRRLDAHRQRDEERRRGHGHRPHLPEVIQKALRMLDIGVGGGSGRFRVRGLRDELRNPTPLRIFAIARALADGCHVDEIHGSPESTAGFCAASRDRTVHESWRVALAAPADAAAQAKQLGFSDGGIERSPRPRRAPPGSSASRHGIVRHLAQIDTLAASFPPTRTTSTRRYHATQSDVARVARKKVLVLGSGAYRIGSSVEFDWCCVNAVQAASELGYETHHAQLQPGDRQHRLRRLRPARLRRDQLRDACSTSASASSPRAWS